MSPPTVLSSFFRSLTSVAVSEVSCLQIISKKMKLLTVQFKNWSCLQSPSRLVYLSQHHFIMTSPFIPFLNHGWIRMHSSCYNKSPVTLSSGERIILLCNYDRCVHFIWLRSLHPSPDLYLNSCSLPLALSVMFLGPNFNCRRSSELHSKWLRVKYERPLMFWKFYVPGLGAQIRW
jgi:hypothetical protein